MGKVSVLVADDDPAIRKLLSVNLSQRNYDVHEAQNGEDVLNFLRQQIPDLLILDLVMPVLNGDEICAWVRGRGSDVPIIVLSAYNEEDLKVRALDAGADDYVTKPFKTEEFLARLRALMRRSNALDEAAADRKMTIEGINIDLKGRRAFVDGADIHLTRTEIALLATLAEHHDAVLTHDELLAKVWGEEYRGSSHYLHVYLGRVRKKIGDKYSALLETVAGLGYVLHSSFPNISPAGSTDASPTGNPSPDTSFSPNLT